MSSRDPIDWNSLTDEEVRWLLEYGEAAKKDEENTETPPVPEKEDS